MQADVRNAVPRTAPATRYLISAGRADEASSREYGPQKPNRPHTRASVALRTMISEACSPTLSVLAEGGTKMAMCNTSKTVRCSYVLLYRNQKQPHLLRIYTRRGRPTDNNSRHHSYRYSQLETNAINDSRYLPTAITARPLLAIT
jgi:hypothetical protein